MLLLMRIAITGLRLFIASLKSLGRSLSHPVVFDESKAFLCMRVPADMPMLNISQLNDR